MGVPMPRYEVRLPYALSDTLEAAFPDLNMLELAPSQTLLIGNCRDQSELYGLLARIADGGLCILEVRSEPS